VISQRGEVLTNWHVIDGAKFIAILLKPPAGQRSDPGDVYEGKLVKYDQIADLALIQFQRPPAKLVALRTGDERSIEVGSSVHAIGHPGGEQWTYTQGIISQVRTDYRWKGVNDLQHRATVIQTQTPINPGNSGGPLLDDNVSVVGVNAFVMQEKQGLNFAISLGEITQFLAIARAPRKAAIRRRLVNPSVRISVNFHPLSMQSARRTFYQLTHCVLVIRMLGELGSPQSTCFGTV
jgi:S1-C subfamily serine protease